MSENVSVHRDGGAGEEVALVVPVYNEGAVIAEVIKATRATFPHIIAVDDGCTDDSAALAHRAGATVLHHAVNLGQGAALQTGISFFLQHTDFPYLATFDSDGQHDPTDVVAMWEQAKRDNLDIVFGSRFLSTHQEMGLPKKIVLKTAAWVTAKSTKMRLTDAHNGLRLLSRRAAASLHLHQNRMAHASEIVAQLGRSGLPWAEAPVNIRYTAYSKAKGQSLWNSINIVADLIMGVR
ncbi:glycosyltransferase family 2 protein [Mobiluncus mulieris]|uniref:Glycosyltransferase family 2 protein n=1 Tax=Mobiluncus mulieris TaxID=2052 RepID=A0ABD4TUS9_9ACTO|nr:glycosyltransferase family 2 protein [Mobiluncus mulieris]MCU9968660.1 glycosyltransferase family 2 protein [Mobiluncus mulieris]MCU9973146.1 glycosyltransferase family 2 protein [Mobiluncus mulieris]MCV0008710.1 glycosyltransferase family 2 protein [Mobiluncus mulieris]NMW74039.1 glycosyltransferase family 2 protein [Mobiluncus mulieris]NMX00659.1 glycosyltransferase family 2 protein [Mobiluncus mulieris]